MAIDREGEKMKVDLKKCLNANSFCDLQINKVFSKKEKVNLLARSSVGGSGLYNKMEKNETRKHRNKTSFEVIETKS